MTIVSYENQLPVIAAQNHPSGAADASKSDKLFKKDLYAALKPIGLKLLDHIVIGENSVLLIVV